MNIVQKVNRDFQSVLTQQDATAQMDFLAREMAKYNMTMKGKPFPTFLKPYLVDKIHRPVFKKATERIMKAIEKVADAFFADPKFKHLLELGTLIERYAKMDPVYPNRQIVTRLDAFFHPDSGDIKFLEFNCDSPSGMGWHDAMVDMFHNLDVIKELAKNYTFHADRFLDTHSDILMRKYQQFCQKKGIKPADNPLFSVVCAHDSVIREDVQIIIDTLNNKGYRAVYTDPREFDYDGNTLTYQGEPVHLIYRDAIQEFLYEPFYPKTEKVLQAYEDQNVCFINPFSSRVGGLKSVLAIMGDPRFRYLFNDDELDAINQFIPWTRLFRNQESDYNGQTVQLKSFAIDNKDNLVLKPNSGYGGKDVCLGKNVDEAEWIKHLDEALAPGSNFVIQELVPIPQDDFPVMEQNKLTGFQPRNVNINFWAYDGVFGGAFLRASSGDIINVHQGGGLVPVFYVS